LGKDVYTAATGKEYSEFRLLNSQQKSESSKQRSSQDDVLAFLDEYFAANEDFNPQQKYTSTVYIYYIFRNAAVKHNNM
jgi:hypothetical protein